MIDTQLHILPSVDDGPETLEESVALAKVLEQEGIHNAIATPHYNDQFPQRSTVEVKEQVDELQQEMDRQDILLRLLADHEVLIKPGLINDVQAGRLALLNQKDLEHLASLRQQGMLIQKIMASSLHCTAIRCSSEDWCIISLLMRTTCTDACLLSCRA